MTYVPVDPAALIPGPDPIPYAIAALDQLVDLCETIRRIAARNQWNTGPTPAFLSFDVAPGDMTRYPMIVGYDPTRSHGHGQWMIGITGPLGTADWFTQDPGDDMLHPGYVAEKIARRYPPTTGPVVAATVASVVAHRLNGGTRR